SFLSVLESHNQAHPRLLYPLELSYRGQPNEAAPERLSVLAVAVLAVVVDVRPRQAQVIHRLTAVADRNIQAPRAASRVVAVAGDREGGSAPDRDLRRWPDVDACANAFGGDDRHGAAV